MTKLKNNIQIMVNDDQNQITMIKQLLQEPIKTQADCLHEILESEMLQQVSVSHGKWGISMPLEQPFRDGTRIGDWKLAQEDAHTQFIQSQFSHASSQQILFAHNQNPTLDDDSVMVENTIDDDYELVDANKLTK
jgi:hypothetical protein